MISKNLIYLRMIAHYMREKVYWSMELKLRKTGNVVLHVTKFVKSAWTYVQTGQMYLLN